MNVMWDAENNHRHYRIERKFGAGSGWRDCIENVPFLSSYPQNVLCYKKKSLIEILSYKFSFLMLSFTDNEPPTFSKCPKDIVREEKVSSIRVNWDFPVFSDNSGVLPSVSSSLQSERQHFGFLETIKLHIPQRTGLVTKTKTVHSGSYWKVSRIMR